MKRKLRSFLAKKAPPEIKNLPKKRKIKLTKKYTEYKNQLREQDKSGGVYYWNRSEKGDLFTVLDSSKEMSDEEQKKLIATLEDSRGYCHSSYVYDVSPRKMTPNKALTETPKKRTLKRVCKIIKENVVNGEWKRGFRVLIFQEDKAEVSERNPKKFKDSKSDPNSSEKMEKIRKRLAFNQDDGSVTVAAKLNKKNH